MGQKSTWNTVVLICLAIAIGNGAVARAADVPKTSVHRTKTTRELGDL